jgi:hypothetical protein
MAEPFFQGGLGVRCPPLILDRLRDAQASFAALQTMCQVMRARRPLSYRIGACNLHISHSRFESLEHLNSAERRSGLTQIPVQRSPRLVLVPSFGVVLVSGSLISSTVRFTDWMIFFIDKKVSNEHD